VKEFLEGVMVEAKGNLYRYPAHEEMLEALYQDLEVLCVSRS
jgi:hypothetical protein